MGALALSPPLVLAVPTTSFVHSLSPDEIQLAPDGRSMFWQSPVFHFGETLTLRAGDSLNVHVEFAGTQYLEFRDGGNEGVGIGASSPVYSGDFVLGGTWTFLGIQGNLTTNDLGVRISNVPVLTANDSLVEPGDFVRFTGVDLALAVDPKHVTSTLSLDGLFLGLGGPSSFSIGGNASSVPEPSLLVLLGLGLGLAVLRRTKA